VRLLQDLRYQRAAHYGGGIAEWMEAGMPLESGDQESRVPEPLPSGITANRTVIAKREGGHAFVDLFERRTTRDLIVLWFGTIVGCALAYWIISATSMGGLREDSRAIDGGARGLLTALYFSFVTATSVGFGDVVPLGAVRMIAIVEAVVGLLVFGAVVSKLVSRRQEQIVGEIHRIAFEDRLERVQTDLHFVLMELQAIAQLCRNRLADVQQIRARLDSASGICVAELRTIHDLLYRPQSLPEEALLEGILATLAMVLRELRELLRCISFDKSAYLAKNLTGVSRYAQDICSECVPRRYAPHLREWMDQIQQTAPDLR
jgi:potassium channel LctB